MSLLATVIKHGNWKPRSVLFSHMCCFCHFMCILGPEDWTESKPCIKPFKMFWTGWLRFDYYSYCFLFGEELDFQLNCDTLLPAGIMQQKFRPLKPEARSNMVMCQSRGNESGLGDLLMLVLYPVTTWGLQNGWWATFSSKACWTCWFTSSLIVESKEC